MTRTLKTGLIGQHISRSRFAEALGILCDGRGVHLNFTPFDTAAMPELDFTAHVTFLRQSGFDGLTVTHPLKPAAHDLARTAGYPPGIGAANILLFGDGGIRAENTDYLGLIAAWTARFGDRKPGIVAVAGAGGVARAIVAALADLGAERILMWDTDIGRAGRTARDLGATAILPRDVSKAVRAAAGIVNATPLGMREYPGSAFAGLEIGGADWLFDAVYTPIHTPLVREAEAKGLQVLTGFHLFRHMAIESFRAYTGLTIDHRAMAQDLMPLAKGL